MVFSSCAQCHFPILQQSFQQKIKIFSAAQTLAVSAFAGFYSLFGGTLRKIFLNFPLTNRPSAFIIALAFRGQPRARKENARVLE